MKKLLALLLVFVMLFSLFACKEEPPTPSGDGTAGGETANGGEGDSATNGTPSAPEANPASDFEYSTMEEREGMAINKYIGTSKNLVFPETIDGLPVTVIGSYLLDDEKMPLIESVIIPDTVKIIAPRTFMGCENLKTVDFGEGVTEILESAFEGCIALEKAILPPKLETIGASAFYECTALEEVFIPKTVTTWGRTFTRGAFGACASLTKITIEEGLETMGFCCEFALSSSLQEIEIPASVKKIGTQLFVGCTSLTKVVFRGNAPIVERENELINVFGYEDFKDDLVIYYDPATEGWDTVEWRGRYRMEPLS